MMTKLRRFFKEGHALQGLQMMLAVAIAYGLSAALGLHESWWAVMSALIVMRANPDATLAAGWQRLGATVAGSVCGLMAVGVVHVLNVSASTSELGAVVALVVVALLAFATAARAGLRGAPIAALIVISGSLAHVSPLAVAAMRTAQVVLGAAVAMVVAWLFHRFAMAPRPLVVVASLLRQLAEQFTAPRAEPASPTEREARSAAVRATVRRLGEMVHGSNQTQHRQLLGLAMRLAQDAALLLRLLEAAPEDAKALMADVAGKTAKALEVVAARLDGGDASPAESLDALRQQAGGMGQADAVLLLQDDLRKLLRIGQASASAKPAHQS